MTTLDWFVSQKGQKEGPFTTSEVVRKVVSGDFDVGALIWKQGMQEWQPLLAHFKRPPTLSVEVPVVLTPGPSSQPEPLGARRRENFFAKHWHGDFSLPFSFWVVGFVGTLVILFLIGVATVLVGGWDFDPFIILAYVGSIWLIVVVWGLLQVVGIWRSARRYSAERSAQGKSTAWAVLTQIAVVFGAIASVANLANTGGPQVAESWQIAFQNDPAIPDFTLRVMRNGTELEIAGGFKYGLSSDVDKVVRASPQIKIVHLNSSGGRVGEAKKLANLIRERGLTTYVSSQCLSACSVSFAAGRERWLRLGAKLGYHSGSFAGRDSADGIREALLGEGLPPDFVSKAVSYSSQQMWYPSEAELRAAKAITGTADGYKFAVSGYGLRPGSEDFRTQLQKHSFFQAVEEATPDIFATIVRKFQSAYVAGTPESVILDDLRASHIAPLIVSRMATADDQLSIEYAILLADQLEWLGQKDNLQCYEYAAKGANTTIVNALSPELRTRELSWSERLIRSRPVNKPTTSSQLEAIYTVIFQKLSGRYAAADLDMLVEPAKVKPAQYGRYCQLAAAMFREISRLPSSQAGYAMRDTFKEPAASSK